MGDRVGAPPSDNLESPPTVEDLRRIGIWDLMVGLPGDKDTDPYKSVRGLLREGEYATANPVEYLFRNSRLPPHDQGIPEFVDELERYGIERAMVSVDERDEVTLAALADHSERFLLSISVDPNDGMKAVRRIAALHADLGIVAVTSAPSFVNPPTPIDDRRYYPIYAKCAELNLPIFLTVGVPGPRVPFGPQEVSRLDDVCYFFPELTIVTRHGGEPWTQLMVKLLLKWPNLYYSTSAFAPKHYPKDIVDFANTRGAEKVLYSGYFPMGLTLERILRELPDVPFRSHVWHLFLRRNAMRVLRIPDPLLQDDSLHNSDAEGADHE